MALFGESYSKFKASDSTVVVLGRSIIEPAWGIEHLIRNTSVFTRKTTFTNLDSRNRIKIFAESKRFIWRIIR